MALYWKHFSSLVWECWGDDNFSSLNIASVVFLGIGRKSGFVEIVVALISRYDGIDTRNISFEDQQTERK